MLLEGSCHCGAVQFSVQSANRYPFNLCYCSVCRTTAGGGGFAVNLGGEYPTLKVRGEEAIGVYQVQLAGPADAPQLSPARRHFCQRCASALWVWDLRWPEPVHPFASAIDTPLPQAPEHTHQMLASRAPWVQPCIRAGDRQHDEYPQESIEQWHDRVVGRADAKGER